jgi:uncharacterized membrane protein YgcG
MQKEKEEISSGLPQKRKRDKDDGDDGDGKTTPSNVDGGDDDCENTNNHTNKINKKQNGNEAKHRKRRKMMIEDDEEDDTEQTGVAPSSVGGGAAQTDVAAGVITVNASSSFVFMGTSLDLEMETACLSESIHKAKQYLGDKTVSVQEYLDFDHGLPVMNAQTDEEIVRDVNKLWDQRELDEKGREGKAAADVKNEDNEGEKNESDGNTEGGASYPNKTEESMTDIISEGKNSGNSELPQNLKQLIKETVAETQQTPTADTCWATHNRFDVQKESRAGGRRSHRGGDSGRSRCKGGGRGGRRNGGGGRARSGAGAEKEVNNFREMPKRPPLILINLLLPFFNHLLSMYIFFFFLQLKLSHKINKYTKTTQVLAFFIRETVKPRHG